MDTNYIIENGYGKLAEYLPDKQGFEWEIEALEDYKNSMAQFASEKSETIKKIKEEIAETLVDDISLWLSAAHDEHLIAFVDDNNYMIDENGNIVKEDE